jgi:16S rRNA (guanine527-N7)-methyltransferase
MTRLVTTLETCGIPSTLADNLSSFSDLFARWNRSINLSAARSAEGIEEHLVDSLHVVPYLRNASRVLDVGSGGGFPVVVAAICLPAVEFTSLEPVHKKHAFLRTAARELELPNLEAFARRIEDHDQRDYDAATSRATFDLREWILMGRERIRPDGIVLGFEAVQRDDLPPPFERHPYKLDGKSRAIIVARRPATGS